MDPSIYKGLCDKLYDKRKASALDLEKQIRDCFSQGDTARISLAVDQVVDIFNATTNPLHARNGGLVGLAAIAIALGVEIAPFAHKFLEPLLSCFSDPEMRIRYFACESMYNICKVSKGEILVYFNPIFDAMSRLAADSEASVKNGAELLDRLLKDIVAESAAVYVPQFPETEKVRQSNEDGFAQGVVVPRPDSSADPVTKLPKKAFSLERFIPLLSERIQVISPFTRSYLVSWIMLLDSVPDLELIAYLPDFLDGLLLYLSDTNADVRTATENLLAEFLREIRNVSNVQRARDHKSKARREAEVAESTRRTESEQEKLPEITMVASERGVFMPENDGRSWIQDREPALRDDDDDYRDTGAWVPGQGVKINHSAIVQILINQLDPPHDDIQQSMALEWMAASLEFAEDIMMPFTPRLIPITLPNLAHHVKPIQDAALRTNQRLFAVIQKLPSPAAASTLPPISSASSVRNAMPSPPPIPASSLGRPPAQQKGPPPEPATEQLVAAEKGMPERSATDRPQSASSIPVPKPRVTMPAASFNDTQQAPPAPLSASQELALSTSRPGSPVPSLNPSGTGNAPPLQPGRPTSPDPADPFDYQATVSALTVQFLSEHEETRVAALKWLKMLHQKAPKKILAMDDGTFPVLLKTLSDPSENVVKHDLQLLAQISSSSEEGYFKSFTGNLLQLFSTDRRLLDTRGSLIVRQLCVSLGAERIYRTFSEILEKEEEDLEFASVIVQKLNLILITAPELSECRKRLKTNDGQTFFIILYRSWCHNAVAVFSLCLLAQAYEHASNLLLIFADLEITVQLLVQIDKLVQLIESPVFTYLRLQLLEPEKYPFLFKCLYGLLMVLPQSSAFVSLRNRLSAVSSMGFLHITPRIPTMPPPPVARSKINREDIKWQDLLAHFRAIQARHEKARRQDLGAGPGDTGMFAAGDKPFHLTNGVAPGSRPAARRKITGEIAPPLSQVPVRPPTLPLSPLNPRARGPPNMAALLGSGPIMRPMSPTLTQVKGKPPLRR